MRSIGQEHEARLTANKEERRNYSFEIYNFKRRMRILLDSHFEIEFSILEVRYGP